MTFPVTTFPWEILYNKDRRGFHPSVPTDNMTRRNAKKRTAPKKPNPIDRNGPVKVPQDPTISCS